MYKIWCKQRNIYFGSWSIDEGYKADGALFESLDECKDQLISYHSVDCDEDEDLSEYSLDDLCSSFEWEIHDEEGNTVAL